MVGRRETGWGKKEKDKSEFTWHKGSINAALAVSHSVWQHGAWMMKVVGKSYLRDFKCFPFCVSCIDSHLRHGRYMTHITLSIEMERAFTHFEDLLIIVWTQLWVTIVQTLWLHWPVVNIPFAGLSVTTRSWFWIQLWDGNLPVCRKCW